jgi:F420-non-reducing hydrogenase iron-sulfur subunit
VKRLLEEIGLEPERLDMFNMSAAMAGEFVTVATDVTERIAALGPSPLRPLSTTSPDGDKQKLEGDA